LETSFENERSTLTIPIIIEEEELTDEKNAENTEENENVPEKSTEKLPEKLGKTTQIIIDEINNNSTVTLDDLSARLEISRVAVKKHIAKLKSRGILERVGPDKGGYWKIINQKH
jgi:ATP-dependent DNA helicase RecG